MAEPYEMRLRGDRVLSLSLEPGKRPTRLWCLSVANDAMTCGAFTGDQREILELLMAIGRIAERVYRDGLPREDA